MSSNCSNPNTINKLNDYQRAKVKEIIAKVLLSKGNQAQAIKKIEKELAIQISQPLVSYYAKELEKEWLAASQRDISEIKAGEVAFLDNLSKEVYSEWKKSKRNAETKTRGTNSKGRFSSFKSQGRTGNPDYINNLVNISKRKADLLGMDAPVKQETKITLSKDIEDMTDDELADLEKEILQRGTDS